MHRWTRHRKSARQLEYSAAGRFLVSGKAGGPGTWLHSGPRACPSPTAVPLTHNLLKSSPNTSVVSVTITNALESVSRIICFSRPNWDRRTVHRRIPVSSAVSAPAVHTVALRSRSWMMRSAMRWGYRLTMVTMLPASFP